MGLDKEGGVIVEILGKVLGRLIDINDKDGKPQVITKFQSSYAPEVTIEAYLTRIHKYARCSDSCFVVALIYIDRMIEMKNIVLSNLNVHRIVVTSVLIAAKFLDDFFYNNAFYAKLGGISTQEMNSLELEFLMFLGFSLQISTDLYTTYHNELRSFVVPSMPCIFRDYRTTAISPHITSSHTNLMPDMIASSTSSSSATTSNTPMTTVSHNTPRGFETTTMTHIASNNTTMNHKAMMNMYASKVNMASGNMMNGVATRSIMTNDSTMCNSTLNHSYHTQAMNSLHCQAGNNMPSSAYGGSTSEWARDMLRTSAYHNQLNQDILHSHTQNMISSGQPTCNILSSHPSQVSVTMNPQLMVQQTMQPQQPQPYYPNCYATTHPMAVQYNKEGMMNMCNMQVNSADMSSHMNTPMGSRITDYYQQQPPQQQHPQHSVGLAAHNIYTDPSCYDNSYGHMTTTTRTITPPYVNVSPSLLHESASNMSSSKSSMDSVHLCMSADGMMQDHNNMNHMTAMNMNMNMQSDGHYVPVSVPVPVTARDVHSMYLDAMNDMNMMNNAHKINQHTQINTFKNKDKSCIVMNQQKHITPQDAYLLHQQQQQQQQQQLAHSTVTTQTQGGMHCKQPLSSLYPMNPMDYRNYMSITTGATQGYVAYH